MCCKRKVTCVHECMKKVSVRNKEKCICNVSFFISINNIFLSSPPLFFYNMLGRERAGQQPKRGDTLDPGVKKNRKLERASTKYGGWVVRK